MKQDARCLTQWATDSIPEGGAFCALAHHRRHGCWCVQVRYADPLGKLEPQMQAFYWNKFPTRVDVQRRVARLVFNIGQLDGIGWTRTELKGSGG